MYNQLIVTKRVNGTFCLLPTGEKKVTLIILYYKIL